MHKSKHTVMLPVVMLLTEKILRSKETEARTGVKIKAHHIYILNRQFPKV